MEDQKFKKSVGMNMEVCEDEEEVKADERWKKLEKWKVKCEMIVCVEYNIGIVGEEEEVSMKDEFERY